MSHKRMEFIESLEDTDYGLIVGNDGTLKGIWIPTTQEDVDIPDEIVSLCIKTFGIDPNTGDNRAIIQ